jgi:heme exporter protein A
MLEATDLECVRGERTLFSGVNFTLRGGTLLLVRGPNGSGKTSLLRMVCGLLMPAAGKISWGKRRIGELGEDYHVHLAYVGHLNAIKDELNASENLSISARLAGLPAAREAVTAALSAFGLNGYDRLPCKVLSQGQKRRVALARLKLSASRSLWVLDEPFTALDAAGVKLTRSLLESHLAGGGIALLTTHQEVEVTAPSTRKIELSS